MKCRHCGSALKLTLIDLGSSPPSNSYISADGLLCPESWFPLRVLVCEACWLVQTEEVKNPIQPFDEDYAYFSSYSTSWLAHASAYVAEMVERFGLSAQSHVVEIASNDGYLLQFVKQRGIPCTGVEPTRSTAGSARAKGIPVVEDFFGARLARQLADSGLGADLMTANNVLAHAPDINDFVAGFAVLLAPSGVATFEFPHLRNLVEGNQFDTIYYEHFFYLSLTAAQRVLGAGGLDVFDVQEIPTHGGSLRVFAQRSDTRSRSHSDKVDEILEGERAVGVTTARFYSEFQSRAQRSRNEFLRFLLDAQERNAKVAAYGAAAKGNTLLNYAGVRSDLISFVVDKSPAKQGRYLPGSRIPIVSEERIRVERPDYIVIFPWNLRAEIEDQLEYAREWGAKFVTAIPRLEIRG